MIKTFNLVIRTVISFNDLEIIDLRRKESPKKELVEGGTFKYPNGGAELVLRDTVTGKELSMPFIKLAGPTTPEGLERAKEIMNEQMEDLIKAFSKLMEEKQDVERN